MGSLLFSPSGRIGPSEFMKGVMVLVILGFILAGLPALGPALGALSVVGIVLYWCWIVLWIKRYHDGGKSGWMCLIPIVVFLIIGGIVGYFLTSMFTDPEAAAAAAEAAASGDLAAVFQSALSGGGVTKTGILVVGVASAVVSYVIAMVFNGMIKSDPHDNQFGPAT